MKKLMLGAAIAALAITASAPSFAREVKEVVGYVKTKAVINERDALFHQIDTSGDGAINFKEFQRHARLSNNYEMFKMNDTNNDDLLTIEEFRAFSKWSPARTADGPSMTRFNFNNKTTSDVTN